MTVCHYHITKTSTVYQRLPLFPPARNFTLIA